MAGDPMKRYYLQRQAAAEPGEPADMMRPLSAQGKLNAEDMGMWLQAYIGRVDTVISSTALAAIETADAIAPALGCDLKTTTTLLDPDPEGPDTVKSWDDVERLAGAAEDVLIIADNPLIGALAYYLATGIETFGSPVFLIASSEVIAVYVDDAGAAGIRWIATRAMAEQAHYARDVDEAARQVAESVGILERKGDGNKGSYTYEEVILKRWILGDGGRSGNCELCVDNSDRGWIDSEDVFDGVFEDVDEPEAHPNCTCTIEYKESRRRVYD
jgi:phosphohistidine phosphatase